jgi:starch synthase
MKILFVASEAAPMAKVGGLADVVGSLPIALRALGEDVRTMIPQYGCIDASRFPFTRIKSGTKIETSGQVKTVDLNLTQNGGVPVYTLENQEYFGTKEVYSNDLERFFFFSRAVFKILPGLDWQPDIVHCHDWLTALVIMWLKKAGYSYSCVFTIHNLAYQGTFDNSYALLHGLEKEWDGFSPDAPLPPRCFMSQGILKADRVTAVSETYAREITTPESGCGLEGLLRYRAARGELSGIVNGLDYEAWNPGTDEYLPLNFSPADLKKRVFNKIALQRVAGLPVNSDIPLIGLVQRMDEQKGIDILVQAADRILSETGVQMVILGRGRENYENALRQIAARYPRQAAVFTAFEEPLAHLIYGGSDMFLMPSRFEPCGLGQMIALRYGALPIVRHTGGLTDTVLKFSPDLGQGNGFIFHEYSAAALLKAVNEAAAAFRNKNGWSRAVERTMKLDYSWQSSARKYVELYRSLPGKKGLQN